MTVLIIIALVLISLMVDFFVQHYQQRKTANATDYSTEGGAVPQGVTSAHGFDEHFLPDGVFASGGHLWGVLTPSGRLRIGVDRMVTKILGPIDDVRLPQSGQQIAKGDPLMQIKQGKRTLRLQSPCDGVIEEINSDLLTKPEMLNSKSLGNAWAIAVRPNGLARTLKSLLVGEEAHDWIKQEIKRLREFLSSASPQPALAQTLQDGGLPAEGVLQQLDDQAWERFQQEFLSVGPQQATEGAVR